MKEKQDQKIEKWTGEIKTLEKIRDNLIRYSALKDEKGEKDKIDRLNAKVAGLIEDNYWTRLEWSTIKRGKQSRAEGLEKIEKKIAQREKKVAARQAELLAEGDSSLAKDWAEARAACQEGDRYYHWAYGEMEVAVVEEDYLYLKVLDKKGCKTDWAVRNNAEVIGMDGEVEEVKEFPRNAIGKWLFPDKEDVKVVRKEEAHKLFK